MIKKLNLKTKEKNIWNNCKAVSEIVGYVLLIGGALTVSILVYAWLKTYVPQDITQCSENVMLFVKKVNCTIDETASTLTMKLILKNNGLFNIDGYMITASDDESKEIADKDIADKTSSGAQGIILFNNGREALKPNEEANFIFNNLETGTNSLNTIAFIQIIPARFEINNGKKRFTPCGNARIKENIKCDIITSSGGDSGR